MAEPEPKPKPKSRDNIPTRHNNPLNLKYGGITKKYVDSGEAELGDKAQDGGRFLKFKNSALGFKAAKDLLFNNFYKDLDVESALRKWSNKGYGIGEIAKHIKPATKVAHLGEDDRDTIINSMAKREGFKVKDMEDTGGGELKNYKLTDNKTGKTVTASFKTPPTKEDIKKVFSTREAHETQREISEKTERERPIAARVADWMYAPSEAIAPEVMAPEQVEQLPIANRVGRLGQEVASGLIAPENWPTGIAALTGPVGLTAASIVGGGQMLMNAPETVKQAYEHPSLETVGRAGILGAGLIGAGAGIKSGMKGYTGVGSTPKVEAPTVSKVQPRAPISRQLEENIPIEAEFVEPGNRMPGRERAQITGETPLEEGTPPFKQGPSNIQERGLVVQAPESKQLTGEVEGAPHVMPSSPIEGDINARQSLEDYVPEGPEYPGPRQIEAYYGGLKKKNTSALFSKRDRATGKERATIDDILKKRGVLPDESETFELEKPIGKTEEPKPTPISSAPVEAFKKENIGEINPEKVIEVQKPPTEEPIATDKIENTWLNEQDTEVLKQMLPGARGQMAREINSVLEGRGVYRPEKVIEVGKETPKVTSPVVTPEITSAETVIPKETPNITYRERTSREGNTQHIVFKDNKFVSSHPTFEAAQAKAESLGGNITKETPIVSKPTSEKPLSFEEQLRASIEQRMGGKKPVPKVEETPIVEEETPQLDEQAFNKYNSQLEDLIPQDHVETQSLRDLAEIGKQSGLDMDTVAQDLIDNTPRLTNNVNRVWAAVKKAFKEEKGSADFIGDIANRIVRKARGTEAEGPINQAKEQIDVWDKYWTKPERVIGRMGEAGQRLENMIEQAQYNADALKGKVDVLMHEAFKPLSPREAGQRIAILKSGEEVPLTKGNMDKYVDWKNGTFKAKSGVQKIVRSRGSLSDVILDNATPMNEKVASSAKLFKQAMDILGEEGEISGVSITTPSGKKIPFNKLEHAGWPRDYTDGFYRSLEADPSNWPRLAKEVAAEKGISVDEAMELLKNKKIYIDITNRGQQKTQFKQDSFAIDPGVVYDHVNNFTGRVGMAQAFGPQDIAGSLVKKELTQLQNEGWGALGDKGSNTQFASDTISRLVGRENNRDFKTPGESTMYRTITNLNNARLMTSFVINNLGGITPIVARVGEANTFKGLAAYLGNMEVARRLATLSGAVKGGIIEQAGSSVGKIMGIPMSERFIRTWADQSGRATANQLVQYLNTVRQSSPEFIRSKKLFDSIMGGDTSEIIERGGLTKDELSRAGWQLAKDTQGLINPATFPDVWQKASQNVIVNLGMQYKRMAAQSMGSLMESMRLNPARTIKTLAITAPILGELIGDTGSALFGSLAGIITGEGAAKGAVRNVQERGESLAGALKPLLKDKLGLNDSESKMISRYIDDMNRGFALGLIGDLIYSAAYWGGKAGGDIMAGGVAPAYEFAWDMSKAIMNDAQDIVSGVPPKRTGIGDIKETIHQVIPQRVSSSIKSSEKAMKGKGSPIVRMPRLP